MGMFVPGRIDIVLIYSISRIRKLTLMGSLMSYDIELAVKIFGGKEFNFGVGTVDININLIWNIQIWGILLWDTVDFYYDGLLSGKDNEL